MNGQIALVISVKTGMKNAQISSHKILTVSFKLLNAPCKVFDCLSIRLANLPHSSDIVLNALVTSLALISHDEIISCISFLLFPKFLDSSSSKGTQATAKSLSSFPVNLPCVITCP